SKAVSFGKSIPVRDMAVASVGSKKPYFGELPKLDSNSTATDVTPEDIDNMSSSEAAIRESSIPSAQDKDEKEINKTNTEPGRFIDPTVPRSPDGALSTNNKHKNLSPQALPTPSVSFEGISLADTLALGQGFIPP